MKRIIIPLILLAVSLSLCELADVNKANVENIDKDKLLKLVNDLRTKGCNCGSTYMPPAGKLSWNEELERAATAHSVDMEKNNYFSHTGLDGSSFADRIKGTNYTGTPGGENIAYGYSTEEAVFNAWLNSEGHCKNMMNAGFSDIAVGKSGTYWTMNFGRK